MKNLVFKGQKEKTKMPVLVPKTKAIKLFDSAFETYSKLSMNTTKIFLRPCFRKYKRKRL